MSSLSFRVSVHGGSRDVVIERTVMENGRRVTETGGDLMWDGDQYSWCLPHEAYRAAFVTPKEVTCILGLLNWLNEGFYNGKTKQR